MPISAEEARQLISQEHARLNNSRRLPPILTKIRALMREDVLYICNVGPWAYSREMGSLGTFIIPAYDAKSDPQNFGYAQSAPIPSVFRFSRIIDENEFGWYEDDGRQVAQEVIGVGFGLAPANSLLNYGVFIPAGKQPTEAELDAARERLSAYYDKLIADARDAYDKGPEERKAVITERHLMAARLKGVDEAWVHHRHTQESVRCRMCGKFNPAGIAKCACGSILDIDLYRRLMAEQEDLLTEPAPKKK